MRLSLITAPVVAVIVGFGGTLAIIIAAARAAGANEVEVASWVSGLCLAMAATTGYLSLRHRIPIVTAWSTPGAALIAALAVPVGMPAAVGAFIVVGLMIVVTGLIRPIGRLIERIPASIAAAMLAGVVIRFVMAVFETAGSVPELVLPLVALFFVARLVSPFGAVLIVLAGGVLLAWLLGMTRPVDAGLDLTTLVVILPSFDPAVLIGLALPLYLVTMASQNLPGFAVLRAADYPVPTRSILVTTGLASTATAFFGAHTSNLAAITASICTGPDVHPDKAERWKTGPFYALGYLILAIFGASLVALFAALPAALVVAVAGLALIGPLVGALGPALSDERERLAAVTTLVVTASGLNLLGIGSAFWGILAGLGVLGLDLLARRFRHRG